VLLSVGVAELVAVGLRENCHLHERQRLQRAHRRLQRRHLRLRRSSRSSAWQPPKANGTSCNDGNTCTTGDTCTNGACGGPAASCDDGNPCTDDSCDATLGCVHVANTASCDDGDACTLGDVCNAGSCVATSAVECEAVDGCHEAGVCDPPAASAPIP
jgi:hypothetical protein